MMLPSHGVVNHLNELTPTELQGVKVLACNGFLVPATLARKIHQPLPAIMEALANLANVGFILTDGGKVAINVYSKQHLGLRDTGEV